jgi:stress response protein YsnF
MTEHDQPMSRPGQDTRLEADASVTRSEEELRITTHRRATHRARLRKRVVTEMVTKTVPVRREEVSLEYEPITADDDDRPRGSTPPVRSGWSCMRKKSCSPLSASRPNASGW